MSERPSAKIDGREIPIEIVGNEEGRERKEEKVKYRYSQTIPKWKIYLPFIVGGLILIGIIFLSITLFVWALPYLLPLFLIIFIVKLISRH